MESKTYKKCEFIIRQFMDMEDCPPELTERFHEWLFDGRNCDEKDRAILELFQESIEAARKGNGPENIPATSYEYELEEN